MKTRKPTPFIDTVGTIVAYLRHQAELRAPENDIAGILLEAADHIEQGVTELEEEYHGNEY